MKKAIFTALALCFGAVLAADQFAPQRAEFAKYYKQNTGKEAPDGIVKFAIDPKVSKRGRDAYRIVSWNAAVAGRPPYRGGGHGRAGSPLPAETVVITGSNLRSVWYGLYDLLERRGGCHWFWDGNVVPKRDYPDAKLLIAGWDFYLTWKAEEVREYLKTLDKDRVILWDYEADCPSRKADSRNFTNWDVIGKFPYTYSMFLAYENALDIRANYPLIEERQKIVQNDPFCKGYILWPESSHTDALGLRFFTANAWSAKPVPHGDVLDEFCASRYGDYAERMKAAWKAAIPASYLRAWGSNYGRFIVGKGRRSALRSRRSRLNRSAPRSRARRRTSARPCARSANC